MSSTCPTVTLVAVTPTSDAVVAAPAVVDVDGPVVVVVDDVVPVDEQADASTATADTPTSALSPERKVSPSPCLAGTPSDAPWRTQCATARDTRCTHGAGHRRQGHAVVSIQARVETSVWGSPGR